MSCCNNHLGNFPHNEDVNTGIIAAKSGQYQFLIKFAGTTQIKKQTVSAGQNLVIPKDFNENYLYKMVIIDPDGEYVLSSSCENFSFKTYICIEDGTCLPCSEYE